MSHPNRGGRNKPCVNPTVAEIRRAQERAWNPVTRERGLTNRQCAELCCVTEHTWESWLMEGPNGRQMPAGAWKLFRYEIGLLGPPGRRASP